MRMIVLKHGGGKSAPCRLVASIDSMSHAQWFALQPFALKPQPPRREGVRSPRCSARHCHPLTLAQRSRLGARKRARSRTLRSRIVRFPQPPPLLGWWYIPCCIIWLGWPWPLRANEARECGSGTRRNDTPKRMLYVRPDATRTIRVRIGWGLFPLPTAIISKCGNPRLPGHARNPVAVGHRSGDIKMTMCGRAPARAATQPADHANPMSCNAWRYHERLAAQVPKPSTPERCATTADKRAPTLSIERCAGALRTRPFANNRGGRHYLASVPCRDIPSRSMGTDILAPSTSLHTGACPHARLPGLCHCRLDCATSACPCDRLATHTTVSD